MDDKKQSAEQVIRQHVIWAVGAGLVPVPVVDFLAVTGIQVDLIKQLCTLYGAGFEESTGKVWVGALTGGAVARIGASALKALPGLGSLLGGLSMSIASGASTYAVGQVVTKHLEAGGTMQNLDVDEARRRYAEAYEKGKDVAKEASQKRKATDASASPAAAPAAAPVAPEDAFAKLEKLGKLRAAGVITEAEFEAKKKSLLDSI
jgi:uncharacterized protein (DUF697 family)